LPLGNAGYGTRTLLHSCHVRGREYDCAGNSWVDLRRVPAPYFSMGSAELAAGLFHIVVGNLKRCVK
jgi:hypothetical protein